jgi:hypothetical protein
MGCLHNTPLYCSTILGKCIPGILRHPKRCSAVIANRIARRAQKARSKNPAGGFVIKFKQKLLRFLWLSEFNDLRLHEWGFARPA